MPTLQLTATCSLSEINNYILAATWMDTLPGSWPGVLIIPTFDGKVVNDFCRVVVVTTLNSLVLLYNVIWVGQKTERITWIAGRLWIEWQSNHESMCRVGKFGESGCCVSYVPHWRQREKSPNTYQYGSNYTCILGDQVDLITLSKFSLEVRNKNKELRQSMKNLKTDLKSVFWRDPIVSTGFFHHSTICIKHWENFSDLVFGKVVQPTLENSWVNLKWGKHTIHCCDKRCEWMWYWTRGLRMSCQRLRGQSQ